MIPLPGKIEEAAALLNAGELVAFPTETVYGLGADATNPRAVTRIFEAKGRPASHPLIVHFSNFASARTWASEVPPAAERLAEAFWPGPLTLVLPRAAVVPDVVTGGQDTVGLRAPAHPVARALLAALSPAGHLTGTHVRLLLVHGRDDPAIPFTESLRLAAAAGPRGRSVIVGLIAHVEGQAPGWRRLPDLARLWTVCYELLAG